MSTGPNGEKRPSNPNAAAVMVGRIATGRAKEEYVDGSDKQPASQENVAAMRMAEPKKTRNRTDPKA